MATKHHIPRKSIPYSEVRERDVGESFPLQPTDAKRLNTQQFWVDADGASGRYTAPGQQSEEIRPRNETEASLGSRIVQWVWDVGGLIISIAILVAIVIILRKYDGQVQPNWRFSFNLNSLVAILMTVLRTTMMEVVSDSMSQLKWNWFSSPRKLRHLEIFDEGSRGPWGSLKLLTRIHRLHPVLLGAVITILSLATGLFAQQAVISVPCVIEETGVSGQLSYRRFVSSMDVYRIGAGQWVLDYSTKAALIDAIANPTGNNSAITTSCPSGNCTFASYEGVTHSSIGLCTECVDITSSAAQSFSNNTSSRSGGVNFTLPNGLGISHNLAAGTGFSYIDVKWDSKLDFSTPTPGNSEVGSISVLQFTSSGCATTQKGTQFNRTCEPQSNLPNRSSSMNVLGVRCSYQACLKNYHSRIVAGSLEEEIISTTPALSSDPLGKSLASVNFTTAKLPCIIEGKSYGLSNISMLASTNMTFVFVSVNGQNVSLPEQCVYGMSGIFIKALNDFMSPEMTGNGIVSSNGGGINGMLSNPNFYSGNWWLASLYNRGNASFASINLTLENVATTFTNYMRIPRQSFLDEYGTPELIAAYAPSIVEGVVERTSICTQFNWPWLIFPASLILLTAALLCMTTFIRHYDNLHMPNWKASLLPLLFYGFGDSGNGMQADPAINDRSGSGSTHLLGRDELEIIADTTIVRFRRTANGAGFEETRSGIISER
ncbi:hypothetical protein VTL71DRAFT_10213 [Oculimacula yallundae]|uniref:Uncharacterized protein n=1 Tax=Oculimacula yallundae TaxID=86028 RepID=A0ABR4BR24_9HELO